MHSARCSFLLVLSQNYCFFSVHFQVRLRIGGIDSSGYEGLADVTEVLWCSNRCARVAQFGCSGEPEHERATVEDTQLQLGWRWRAIGGNWLGKHTYLSDGNSYRQSRGQSVRLW